MTTSKTRYYTSSDTTLNASQNSPLSYVDWLQYEPTFDRATAFEEYTKYLNEWYKAKGIDSAVAQQQYVKNIYTELLKQVALEYTTPDEKRFLENIDYNDKNDLDIALPFFAKKLKQIAIYYASQRDELKYSTLKSNLKGSSYGLNQIIYKQISELVKYDPVVVTQLADIGLTPQDVLNNLRVDSQELYDTEQNYFNVPNSAKAGEYTSETTRRYNYFDASIIPDRAKMFLQDTFNETIIETIRDVPVLMTSGIDNVTMSDTKQLTMADDVKLAITDIITGTELDRLNDQDFLAYTNTDNNSDLNITYEQLAFQKYSGTDYYYLSTGDTLNEVVSGRLFSAANPHREILNRFYPTIVPTQGENVYREEYLGGFFTTTGIGLQTYTTLDFTYYYTPAQTNTTYYFPDPNVGAKGFFGSAVRFDTVVEYYENVNWQKQGVTNQYNYGLQRQLRNITKFTPYQSIDETTGTSTGVFRHDDKFDFWNASGNNTWENVDVYPLNEDSTQPLQARQDELVAGEQVIYNWKTDLYGNNYALVKENLRPLVPVPVNTNSDIYQTELIQYSSQDYASRGTNTNLIDGSFHENKNLTEQQHVYGTLHIKNNSSTGTEQLTSQSISGIYSKYTSTGDIQYRDTTITINDIANELENQLTDFDIVYDNIIFETPNYIVFEKIQYDYSTGEITSGHKNFAFIYKNYHGHKYEQCSNWWFDEANERFVVAKTTIHPTLSASTDKMIYPEIYVYDPKQFQVNKVYPDNDYTVDQLIYETSQFSLSAINNYNIVDVTDVKPPKLTYNQESERYTLMQLGKDASENMYLLKNDFLMYDNTVDGVKPSIYKNQYTIYTVNPHNEDIRNGFFAETNPDLYYINYSKYTFYHDTDRQLLFMGSVSLSGDPAPPDISGTVKPSGCVWIHGTLPQNMQTERDITMCFDFMTCGYKNSPGKKPHGLSVVFFNARVIDIVNTDIGASEPQYEIVDDGGLGPAFGYLDDITHGTGSYPSLSGLDSGHACVALDVVGQIGNDTTVSSNNITIFGPYETTNSFKSTTVLDPEEFNMYSDIDLYDDYVDLPFIRCKVTLTDVGRKITVHMKNLNSDQEYQLVKELDLPDLFEPSRVTHSGQKYKCMLTHISTTSDPTTDTRVLYSGAVYRCLRDHESRTAAEEKTPDVDTRYWTLDEDWTTVNSPPAAWINGGTYTTSKWILDNNFTGVAAAWSQSKKYTQLYIQPDRVKAALISHKTAANDGLVVIKNITVTGAGNNV